jgi:hypothetical protein
MKTRILLLMFLPILGCQTTSHDPQPMAKNKAIEIVFESSSNLPGIADNVDVNGMVVFTSFVRSGAGFETFKIIFDAADVPNAFNFNASSQHTVSNGKVIFTSEPHPNANSPSESRVNIKWNNAITHPTNGYKYAISMKGQILDPRVRPK